MKSDGYPSARDAADAERGQGTATAEAKVFALAEDDEVSPSATQSASAAAQDKAKDSFWTSGGEAESPDAGSSDWYDLDDADANKLVQQEQSAAPSASSRFSKLLGTASSLRQKASPFLSKAKQAIVEEAKMVKDDVRDIAGGVREGMQLTHDDLKAQTAGWRSVLGNKFRPGTVEKPAPDTSTAGSSSSTANPAPPASPRKDEHEGGEAGDSRPNALETLRQNLAVTADASKEMWRDIKQLNQEVFNEVRLGVNDIQQVSKQVGQALQAQRSSASEASAPAADAAEEYWRMPSTRSNYVEVVVDPQELPKASEAAVDRVRELGGKLKGSLARKRREVTSGVASIASDLRSKKDSLLSAAEDGSIKKLGNRMQAKLGIAKNETEVKHDDADAADGDAIFEIGSDEEDAWSDHDGVFSDGNTSETPSSLSASAKGAGLQASEAESTDGV